MKWKKSWFTYTVWVVYSIVLCLYLAIYINAQCVLLQLNKYATVAAVCVVFLCIFGVYRLLCLIWDKWGGKLSLSCHTKTMLEVFLVLSMICGAILSRIYWYSHHFTECLGTLEFFEMATVRANGSIPVIRHGASYLYTGMLSVLFAFFGNKQTVGIVMQMVLQILGILCFYFAVRNFVGKKEALLSLTVMAFFPAMIRNIFSLTPENLYFFLYAGMFLLLSVYKKYEEKGRKTLLVWGFLVLLGIGCGYLVYLDIVGLLFFVAVLFVILSKKRKKGKNASYLGFVAGSTLCGLSGLFLLECMENGNTFLNTLLAWGNLYVNSFSWNWSMAGPELSIVGNLFLLSLAGWVVLGFFKKKEDDSSLYMLSIVILVCFVSFGKQNMSYQLLTTAYWSILVAIGVFSVMITGKNEGTVKRKGAEMVAEQTVLQPEEKKQEIHFIENPLPLPKKHVKKTMNYGFEPDNELMKYDIETSDDDDFDLQ